MKNKLNIETVMTKLPHTIGQEIPIKKAMQMMREKGFRHLPVQEEGKLVGIISDRDIKLAASFADAADLTVEDVMSPDPYIVYPDTELKKAITTMAEHKYGSCIVVNEKQKVIGIFTAIDALKLLAEYL